MKITDYLDVLASKEYNNITLEKELNFEDDESTIKSRLNYVKQLWLINANLKSKVKYDLLQDFLEGNIKDSNNKIDVIPCSNRVNKSQIEAISSSFKKNISIIQGPPGTGKTTTMLSILSSLSLAGKSSLVVSSNNKPLDDIYKSLHDNEFPFIYFKKNNDWFKKDFLVRNHYDERTKNYNPSIKADPALLKKVSKLADDVSNYKKLNKSAEDMKNIQTIIRNKIDNYDHAAKEHVAKSEKTRIGFIRKIILKFNKDKINKWKLAKYCKSNNLDSGDLKISMIKFYSLLKKYKEINFLVKSSINPDESYKEMINILNSNDYDMALKAAYKNINQTNIHELLKTYNCINGYVKPGSKRPLITVSTLASTFSYKILKEKERMKYEQKYDYLIIDESGQARIEDIIPALAMSKNVIIIGDTKQIPPIATKKTKDYLSVFPKMDRRVLATENSVQSYIEKLVGGEFISLLDEHYRCAPEIIGFSNNEFYNNKLIIKNKSKAVLETHDYVPHETVQTMLNIVNKINDPRKTIGIISPNRFDKKLKTLEKQLKKMTDQIQYGTVHTFQGAECDAIVIYVPYEGDISSMASDFVNNPNLINVAVTRAKTELYLVADKKIIESFNDNAPLKRLHKWIDNKGILKHEDIKENIYKDEIDLKKINYIKDIELPKVVGDSVIRKDVSIKDVVDNRDDLDNWYEGIVDSVTIKNNYVTSCTYMGKQLSGPFKNLVKNELTFEKLLNDVYSDNEHYVLRGPMLKTIIDIDKLYKSRLITRQAYNFAKKAHFDLVILQNIEGRWLPKFIVELDGNEHRTLRGVINDSLKATVTKSANINLKRISNSHIRNYKEG